MSGRLSEVRARIDATRQLEAVVTAMRGLAAARSREAQNRLAGVRAYASALGNAIGDALSLVPEAPGAQPATRGHVVLAICAEQGFAGAFSERVLEAVRRRMASSLATGPAELFLVGERGRAVAEESGLAVEWATSMATRADEAPAVADRIANALYERLGAERTRRVTMVYSAPRLDAKTDVVERPLIPLDLARFSSSSRRVPPATNLPPARLLARLAQEYVFAELCEAVVLSFAAENEARMQAMTGARRQAREKLSALDMDYRRIRQDEITSEIIELTAR